MAFQKEISNEDKLRLANLIIKFNNLEKDIKWIIVSYLKLDTFGNEFEINRMQFFLNDILNNFTINFADKITLLRKIAERENFIDKLKDYHGDKKRKKPKLDFFQSLKNIISFRNMLAHADTLYYINNDIQIIIGSKIVNDINKNKIINNAKIYDKENNSKDLQKLFEDFDKHYKYIYEFLEIYKSELDIKI